MHNTLEILFLDSLLMPLFFRNTYIFKYLFKYTSSLYSRQHMKCLFHFIGCIDWNHTLCTQASYYMREHKVLRADASAYCEFAFELKNKLCSLMEGKYVPKFIQSEHEFMQFLKNTCSSTITFITEPIRNHKNV